MSAVAVEPVTARSPRAVSRALLRQRWRDVALVHWPVPVAAVAPLLPPGTVPDTFEGETFVGLVPFRMSRTAVAGLPPVPYLGDFPETNVRLYCVDDRGRRGVVFRSLDASRLLPVLLGRWVFGLPYAWSAMRLTRTGDTVEYRCRRRWPRRLDRSRHPAEADREARSAPSASAAPGSVAGASDHDRHSSEPTIGDRRGQPAPNETGHDARPGSHGPATTDDTPSGQPVPGATGLGAQPTSHRPATADGSVSGTSGLFAPNGVSHDPRAASHSQVATGGITPGSSGQPAPNETGHDARPASHGPAATGGITPSSSGQPAPSETSHRARPASRGPAVTRIAIGEPITDPSPLEQFLTARWGLCEHHLGRTRYLPNVHEPWPLYRARLLECDTAPLTAAGLPVGEAEPVSVLYSPGVTARFGRPLPLGR